MYTWWSNYYVDLYTSLWIQIFNKPIMWQQLNAYKHADVIKRFSWFSARMQKKCDRSDFDCGMIVGARQGGLSISETADRLVFSQTTVSRVKKTKNIQ